MFFCDRYQRCPKLKCFCWYWAECNNGFVRLDQFVRLKLGTSTLFAMCRWLLPNREIKLTQMPTPAKRSIYFYALLTLLFFFVYVQCGQWGGCTIHIVHFIQVNVQRTHKEWERHREWTRHIECVFIFLPLLLCSIRIYAHNQKLVTATFMWIVCFGCFCGYFSVFIVELRLRTAFSFFY